jgi:hypothetical protein
MKRLILAAAALAVPLFASASQAVTVSIPTAGGQLFMKYRNVDVGKLYDTVDTPSTEADVNTHQVFPSPNTTPLPGSSDAREDSWGIAIVDEIRVGGQFGTLVYQAQNPALQGNIQVSAIFYGTHDIQVTNNTNGTQTIDSNNVFVDFYASLVGNNADGLDFPTNPDANTRTNLPGNIPQFAGVTDGMHIFSFVSHTGSLANNANASFETTINPNLTPGPTGVIGGGTLFLDTGTTPLGTGVQNNIIAPGPANQADAIVSFTTLSPPANSTGFNVGSNDPLLATLITPVPQSAWAGGALMAGFGLTVLRRRRATT